MFQGTPDEADLKHLKTNVKPLISKYPSYLIKKNAETLWCRVRDWDVRGCRVPDHL